MKRRTTRIKLGPFKASELQAELKRRREEAARRNGCAGHRFVRVGQNPPTWFCANCQSGAPLDYVRGFASGVAAAGGDPAAFIADFGAWP